MSETNQKPKPTFIDIEQLIIDVESLQFKLGDSAATYRLTRDESALKKYQSISKKFWDKHRELITALGAYGCNHD